MLRIIIMLRFSSAENQFFIHACWFFTALASSHMLPTEQSTLRLVRSLDIRHRAILGSGIGVQSRLYTLEPPYCLLLIAHTFDKNREQSSNGPLLRAQKLTNSNRAAVSVSIASNTRIFLFFLVNNLPHLHLHIVCIIKHLVKLLIFFTSARSEYPSSWPGTRFRPDILFAVFACNLLSHRAPLKLVDKVMFALC